MKYRKLRIAWSVAWGLMAVLLCVLWVRSYSRIAYFGGPITSARKFDVRAVNGQLWLSFDSYSREEEVIEWEAQIALMDDEAVRDYWNEMTSGYAKFGFGYLSRATDNSDFTLIAPIWLPCGVVIALSAFPWLRWRFRFRTLLIATTLVAVGLGLAYTLRK